MWGGEKASKNAIHRWVEYRLPKLEICPKCKIRKPRDLSNTGHTYKRNLKDWEWLCRKCHAVKDGRDVTMREAFKFWKKWHNIIEKLTYLKRSQLELLELATSGRIIKQQEVYSLDSPVQHVCSSPSFRTGEDKKTPSVVTKTSALPPSVKARLNDKSQKDLTGGVKS